MAEVKNKQQQINTDEQTKALTNEEKYIDDLVSIITPAYNAAAYITETIESVLAQTYTKWEMLIVNDCSKDNTEEIVQSYAKKDKRIKLINLKQNSGAATARNTAIQNAKGRYIAFLDSDDLWKKEKLQKQLKFMQHNGYAFTFTEYQYLKQTTDEEVRIIKIPKSLTYEQSLKNTIIGCLTVMVDRKQTENFEMPLVRAGQDHLTWWLLMKRGFKAYGLQENLAEYRRVEGSISHNRFKAIKRHWKLYREYEKLSLIKSAYCFMCYALHAVKKHYM